MKSSNIEWTDATFNPWIGCTKVSPGCANCYAATQDKFRKWTPEGWGAGKPRKLTSEHNWKQPRKWNMAAENDQNLLYEPDPTRPRVFCASLADWLDEEVPIVWLADLLNMIHDTPCLDWLLLSKRPQNWLPRIEAVLAFAKLSESHSAMLPWLSAWHAAYDSGGGVKGSPTPPTNVWIGTTVEDQERANERIPLLLSIPAQVRFLSCEPMLGPLTINSITGQNHEKVNPLRGYQTSFSPNSLGKLVECGDSKVPRIHWVICGGESGPGARPMNPDWARSLRDQCGADGVAFFFKQWGGVMKKKQGRTLDGKIYDEIPGKYRPHI